MNKNVYEYDAIIQSSQIGKGGAYVAFPYDVRAGTRKIPCHF
jgi:hypothetical protein